jgi:hypothetical protein
MTQIRLLQDDCSAYFITGKNGDTIEVDPALAERMIASGHATLSAQPKEQTPKSKTK